MSLSREAFQEQLGLELNKFIGKGFISEGSKTGIIDTLTEAFGNKKNAIPEDLFTDKEKKKLLFIAIIDTFVKVSTQPEKNLRDEKKDMECLTNILKPLLDALSKREGKQLKPEERDALAKEIVSKLKLSTPRPGSKKRAASKEKEEGDTLDAMNFANMFGVTREGQPIALPQLWGNLIGALRMGPSYTDEGGSMGAGATTNNATPTNPDVQAGTNARFAGFSDLCIAAETTLIANGIIGKPDDNIDKPHALPNPLRTKPGPYGSGGG